MVNRIDAALNQHSNAMLGVGSGQDFTTLPQDLEALATEPQTALSQFRAKKARAQNAVGLELQHAQTDFARAYRDYRAFRIQHGLTDSEPRYDDVVWRKVFWLALMFIVEVAANGWVIGQASPGGLVQGWTTALMISILVVLTGTLVGMGPWRYLNYRGADGKGGLHKIWAIPTAIIGCSMLLLFAFYVAHYRYALSHTSLDAPVPDNILTGIMTHPFEPFQQLESLVLFAIALLIGIFAIVRGAYWDEPYPGYGARHRKLEEAREVAFEVAQKLAREVDVAKQEADAGLLQIHEQSVNAVGALRQAIARTQDNAAAWDFTVAEAIAVGREAIGIYRDANRQTRSAPVPAGFKKDPFGGQVPPTSAQVLDKLQKSFQRATANITACKSQIAGARAQLEAEYHSFYDDELTPFLKNIEDNAHANARQEFAEQPAIGAKAPKAIARAVEVEEVEEEDDEEAPRPIWQRWARS
ncbi:MAG: hypothetical protein WDN76_11125 [Alphaproteobacteria bacterium]